PPPRSRAGGPLVASGADDHVGKAVAVGVASARDAAPEIRVVLVELSSVFAVAGLPFAIPDALPWNTNASPASARMAPYLLNRESAAASAAPLMSAKRNPESCGFSTSDAAPGRCAAPTRDRTLRSECAATLPRDRGGSGSPETRRGKSRDRGDSVPRSPARARAPRPSRQGSPHRSPPPRSRGG